MIGARATRDMQTFLEAASSGATVELVPVGRAWARIVAGGDLVQVAP